MKPEIYLLTISLPLITAIIVFAMKYASSYAASRARSAEERDFSKLVESHRGEFAQIKNSLSTIAAEMAEQSRAISSVETILKQVG
jgi:predicted ATP-binding protein involved in virulence